MKKSLILMFFAFSLLILASFSVSAALNIEKKAINDVVISEFSDPAVFNLQITNTGPTDTFEIYSLVGVDILPKEPFEIASGQTKSIDIQIYPNDKTRKRTLTFVYKIKGQNLGVQEDVLTIDIVSLKEALEIGTYDINPKSEQAAIYVKNRINFNFPEVKVKFDSAFFSTEQTFSLAPFEKKEFNVPLDKARIKSLVAGQYILTGSAEAENVKESLEGKIRFVEESEISPRESSSGIIFKETIAEKTNDGNLPTVVEIKIKKDIISRLFTTFSTAPDRAQRSGLIVEYSWVKELRPGERLYVRTFTNYLYPLLILIVIILIAYFVYQYNVSHLIIRKKVGFVRTKGGEFALKIKLTVSSKKFVEKISVIDRIPTMASIYERFGAYPPDMIDEKNKRLQWNIESLQPGEERVFSYIIYSKIGVVGRFELPKATAVYEKDGKILESESNKAFFVNEPARITEE
jgi:hypothetical protein